MATRLYLSLLPEALIASMLEPEDFGSYYAVGTKQRSRGQAIFFEIDPGFRSNHFRLETISARCVPHADGSPKRSVYLSVYRVLEHIPLDALGRLYLVTDDGRVLALERGEWKNAERPGLHLYQELCPVRPRIASSLEPRAFARLITDRTQPVWLPKIVFVDLDLGPLAQDPLHGDADALPYGRVAHLRDCLAELGAEPGKKLKTVTRQSMRDVLFRTVRNGFFAADADRLVFYPFPARAALESEHYEWWRSAQTIAFEQGL